MLRLRTPFLLPLRWRKSSWTLMSVCSFASCPRGTRGRAIIVVWRSAVAWEYVAVDQIEISFKPEA
jgi:hypothetical protein